MKVGSFGLSSGKGPVWGVGTTDADLVQERDGECGATDGGLAACCREKA